ncbi:MAG: HTH tetR-type domain-containing protein [Lachnoclostridium sp.]|jgi:AcrR family transcriptional regulator
MSRDEQKIRSEQVRQAILDTALKIGIEEGFEGVSIRKIIKKMNYSTGVVYHHFKDKEEIISAIEKSQTEWLRSQITEILKTDDNVVDQMKKVFYRITRLAYEEPEKYNLIVLHKYSRNNKNNPEWTDYLSKRLKEGMDAGFIKKTNPDYAAFSVWSSFLGFNLMISKHTDLSWKQAEELFFVQFNIILKGVLKLE